MWSRLCHVVQQSTALTTFRSVTNRAMSASRRAGVTGAAGTNSPVMVYGFSIVPQSVDGSAPPDQTKPFLISFPICWDSICRRFQGLKSWVWIWQKSPLYFFSFTAPYRRLEKKQEREGEAEPERLLLVIPVLLLAALWQLWPFKLWVTFGESQWEPIRESRGCPKLPSLLPNHEKLNCLQSKPNISQSPKNHSKITLQKKPTTGRHESILPPNKLKQKLKKNNKITQKLIKNKP